MECPPAGRSQRVLVMPPVIVGTHHKTGTVYALNVFRELSLAADWRLWEMEYEPQPAQWDIAFHSHVRPHLLLPILNHDIPIVHFIRHPKSLILSAARYHLDAEEEWLDSPEPWLGGQSYRQVLAGMKSFEEKLLFEMQASSRLQVVAMKEMAESSLPMLNVKLEEIAHDTSLAVYVNLLRYIGCEGRQLLEGLSICVKHALWAMDQLPQHSRGGVTDEWKSLFSDRLNRKHEELFHGVEALLGYA